MEQFKIDFYLFIIPGIIGNMAHMIIVKKDLFSMLARPVSTDWFGKNKTFRGFVFLPLSIGTICFIESIFIGPFSSSILSDFGIGAGLGLAYMLAELPNSFIKRRLGIAPGETGKNTGIFQLIIDKSDSLLGACIFYFFAMKTSIHDIIFLFIVSFLLHISISSLLVIFKLKKSI